MIIAENPFGQDPMDFNDETEASRVGGRIRKIRIEKGLTQAELGERVGLNADRIQKYENGVRKPKKDMLKRIASALNVSTLALADPNTTTHLGAMYAFFEMEDHFNIKIEKAPQTGLSLSFNYRSEMYEYLEEWYKIYSVLHVELKAASSQEEKDAILKEYHDWEWNFPRGIEGNITREEQKARLKNKIDELQEAYDKLNREDDLR